MTSREAEALRGDYATETGLQARRAAYAHATGPDAPGLLFGAIAEARPQRYVEVGCGPGELAARVAAELGCEVVAVDTSPRMVELARGRGVDARVADVQQLPFEDASFDCAVAAWMLYHVPDVPRALGELARVLRPGGRLVAVTNGVDHLQELRELLGLPCRRPTTFSSENALELVGRSFSHVVMRDAGGTVVFPDREAVVRYVRASAAFFDERDDVPELDAPLTVRRSPVVLVAER